RPFASFLSYCYSPFFFFPARTSAAISTLSLHDALPIWGEAARRVPLSGLPGVHDPVRGVFLHRARSVFRCRGDLPGPRIHLGERSEEHTSELQSRSELVSRLLLEKKNIAPPSTSRLSAS